MRIFRDLSIDKKLMLATLATSAVSLAAATAGFVAYEVDASRAAADEQLATLAGVIASNVSTAVEFDDLEAAQRDLATLASERQIVVACVYGVDGALLTHYRRERAAADCPASPRGSRRVSDGRLSRSQSIRSEVGEVGTLHLESDLEAVRARLARYAEIVVMVILGSMLVAFLLSSRLQSAITEPILSLAGTARAVSAQQDFSVRARGSGRDEVGQLIEAFNTMLAEIQQRDAAIRSMADHDALTGLPNRRLFKDRVRVALTQAPRHRRRPAVLFLDLDRFKVVNDSLGHDVGDRLLQRVGELLTSTVRESDTVARLGGDEFTVLLPDPGEATDAARAAEKIQQALRLPLELDSRELYVTSSIGVAVFPEDGEDVDTLIKNADTAMYRAKESGRDNYQLYTAEMNTEAGERLALESRLRRALDNGELELHYQPVVGLADGAIHGVEALLRWRHPERGLVSPGEFIPIAEATGLIVPIGAWALREACAQARRWREETGYPRLTVAVNLSARQLQSDVAGLVRSALDETGLDPSGLELEITESSAMQSPDAAIQTLAGLRELGVKVSLDDFGVGHSSLNYLRRLPIDTVKIDRSFVRELPADADDTAIVTAVVEMAHAISLSVVAEGVETREQRECLRELACDRMQGYFFSRPLPEAACAELLRERAGPGGGSSAHL